MKPHLPSALRRALLACCALSVGFTLSSGIAAADTTLGKTDTITIDYAASSTQTPLDADGVLTLTGDTKLMLLNMGDITGFSYTLCTGVSGLQTADGELTLTTGNNSAEAYFDTTAPGSSIWADASLQWVSDRLLLVLNNTRVKDSVTITERQTGSVDYQEYKGVSFESITGGTIIGLGDSTMSNNGSVSFSNNSNYQGGAIFADWCTITMSKNGSVSFNANSADDNGGAIDVHYEGELTLSNNGSVSFLENKATADGGAIFGSDDSSITLSGNGSISFSGNISYLDGGAMTGLFGTTIELNNNSSISISENTATRNGGAIHDYESSISLNENGSVSFSKNAAGGNGGAANIESDGLFTLSNNGNVSFSENTADLSGGAIYGWGDSSLTLSSNDSVEFIGNSASDGGAIYGSNDSTIALSNNGSVVFEGNTVSYFGGAIYGSTITLNGNGNVEFIKNQGSGGSAIYGNTIELNGNESVKFSENNSPDSSTIEGSRGSRITISDNGRVEFSKNHGARGGAFYSPVCQLSMCNNDSVTFIENTTASIYDVIELESGSTISLNHNGSISFIRNTAASALSSYMEELSLSHNGSVTFEENKCRALLANYKSTIKLSNNGSVSICRNKGGHGSAISVEGDVAKLVLDNNDSVKFVGNIDEMERYNWGVLYGRWGSTIIICNNREVLFEKNITNRWSNNNIFLRSIYSTGELGGLATLVMGAPENGNITFSDSIYADGVVELNAAYDHDGDASTDPIAQCGTITFTGEQAEADLKSYLDDNNITLSTSKLASAIRQSKTSTLNATTTLYDGTLEVKKGAILVVGNTLTVNDGATLAITDNGLLRNCGTLTLNGKTILGSTISNADTVKLGGTIDISGITPYETGISVRVNEFGYEGTRSGFLREGDCRIKVVDGGTIEDTGATIDYNGEVVTGVSTLADGIVQVKTQDINYREYLLENTDNATYSNIATASGGQLERISLRGGILNLDSSLDSGVTLKILGDIRQSIDMWENVVLSKGSLEELSDSRELIISGRASSVYEITGELGLGAGVSLKDWNGTVRATDSTLSSGGVDTTEWNNTELKGVTTVRQGATLTLGGNVLLCGKISNSGTLNLTGNITVDAENFSPEDAVKEVLDYYIGASALPNTKNSGFESAAWDITIAEGGVIDGSAATWTVTGIDAAGLRFDSDGTLHAYGKEVGSVFHVAAGDSITYGSGNEADFTNSKGVAATGISLNGGTLVLNTALRDTSDDYVKSTADSTVEIGNGVELSAAQLDASAADVTLAGAGGYTMESGANTLGEGVSVGADWSGTVNTTGDTSALELDSLGVSGSKVELGSDSHTLADRNQSVAADLNSTGSVSLTGKDLTLSGNNTLGSLSVGSLAITGGSTKIASGITTTGESSVADGASLSIDGASALGGKITLGTGSTLTLDGTITVNKDSFAPEDAVVDRVGYFIGSSTTPNSTNSGFEAACWDITIAEGGTITDKGADWQLEGDADADFSFEADGTLHAYGSGVGSVFHVAAGDSIIYGSGNEADFTNSKGTEATCISLNGGTLVLNTGLRDNREDYVKSTAASTVEIGNGVELKAAQLDASAADVTLAGTGGYTMESGANTLGEGVSVGSDWSGKVSTTGDTTALELDKLGVSGSTVELGSDSHTLADRNQSVAADLNSTGSISLTGKELTLSGNNTLGSLSVGSLAITGGSTKIASGLTTAGESSVADGASLSIDGASAIGGKITLGTGSTLTLDGTITVNKDSFAPEDAVVEQACYFIGNATTPNSTNSGFEAACWDITIAEGGTITDNGANWQLEGDADADFSFESDGTLHAYGSDVGSVFHVAAGDSITYGSENEADFKNSKGVDATGISLNGGTLVLNTGLRDNREDYVKSTAASTVEIGSGVELSAAQLDASAADVTLAGAGGYTMESGANALGEGVSVGSDWSGKVSTTGDTSALELDSLGVSGSKVELGSDSHTLADRNQSLAADLNSTGSVSLTGKELTLSGNNTLGSVSVGSLVINGASTAISHGLTTAGESSVADGASLSIDGASAIGGKITLGTGSTLTLDGTITVNKDSFAPEDAVIDRVGYFIGNATTPNSTNSGFEAACWDITIAEGGTITDNGADWQLEGDADADFSFESDGTLHAYGSGVGSVFHVAEDDSITYGSENEDDFKNSKGVDATGISLNGGTLVLNTGLRDNREDYVKSTAASTVEIGSDVELKAAQLDASAAEVTLAGTGGYDLESGSALAGGVKLGSGWKGTVYTGAIAAGTESLDVNHLGNTDSTVQLGKNGDASMNSLTADAVGTVVTPGALSLMSQTSQVRHLTVKGGLTLGSADAAATLIATGALSTQGITLGNIGSTASAAMLLDDTLNLTVADSELLKLTGSTTVLTLGSAYAGTTTLNGEEEVLGSNGKMVYSLVWQTPLTRAAAASSLVLQADTNPVYVQNTVGEQVKQYSYNGRAGLRILNAAYAEHNPQQNAAGGALAGLIDTVDAGKMTDRDLAAVAGASTAVLGQAFSGDVERQLRAIRNRAAMGNHGTNSVAWDGKGGLVSTSLPSRYFAWVNAEGNRAEQNADGTAPGYTLNSWGGTVGAGMQVNSNLTMGLALSAMYGDLRSDGPDSLDGDMDTTYLSAFARYESGKWSHAFIGTAGTMEADYKRTVSHATDSYHTYGDTDGTAFGLMYEVSRDFTLGSKGSLSPVFNISYRHAEVDGYSESGADAALSVGEQSLDTMTLGLGARYAAVVGERAFNRACAFEARALAKYDFGDTQNNIGVGFVNQATRANIESAEMGAFGVELGAGISVPVGKGSIFADGAVELRSDYTNFNATVGYKIQF